MWKLDHILSAPIALFSIGIVLLAMIGGVLNYSPVPYWDMWDGQLGFFMRFSAGDWSALWAQHNEHRIVLTRLLFWLDLELFGGNSVFLFISNYLLAAATAALFGWVLKRKIGSLVSPRTLMITIMAATAWVFLWTQWNNFTWAFQSQFFLAQILPLAALLALAKYAEAETQSNRWFWVALGLGVLSYGTMANGILALPAMIVVALAYRLPARQIALISVTTLVCMSVYFHGYKSNNADASLIENVLSYPVDVLRYTFRYMGSPLHQPVGGNTGYVLSEIAGIFIVTLSALTAFRVLLVTPTTKLNIGLIIFVGYIICTALVTSGGRVSFGLETATSSRYTTPALMAWLALFCIYSVQVFKFTRSSFGAKALSLVGTLLICSFLFKFQLTALKSNDVILHNRMIAALSLELGFADTTYVSSIFPSDEAALAIGGRATAQNISIFGQPTHLDLAERIGDPADPDSSFECSGSIDIVSPVEGTDQFHRIIGWQFDTQTRRGPDLIELIDQDGLTIGYALPGMARPDVAEAIDKRATRAGFVGYVLATRRGQHVQMEGDGLGCRTMTQIPE